MIKPTVGRVVWLWNAPLGTVKAATQPFAATIAYVYDDQLISVSYVDHNGDQYGARHVKLLQDDQSGIPDPKEGERAYCTWMPYQVGQARQQPPQPVSTDTAR